MAKPNLRINGRNVGDYDDDEQGISVALLREFSTRLTHVCQDMDQFDEALDRRVWSLSDQRLKWDLEIALKRRGVPIEVETLMRDLIVQQREHDKKVSEGKDPDMEVDDEASSGTFPSSVNPPSRCLLLFCPGQPDLPPLDSELPEFGAEVHQVCFS